MHDAMPAQGGFTLKQWEEIIGGMISSNENRKREYTRWTAAGITAALALLSLFLDRLSRTDMGPNPALSVLLIWVLAYLITRLGWELLEANILSAVRAILAGEEPRNRPWDTVKILFDLAEVQLSPRRLVLSPLGVSFAVTLVLFFASISLWSQPISQSLLYVALWRLVLFLVYVPVFRSLRKAGIQMLPEKERIRRIVPAEYPAEALRRERVGSTIGMLLIAIYYSVQIWFLWSAIEISVPLTYDVFQLSLLALGVSALVTWMRAITWPLVEFYSSGLRKLQALHGRIISGKLTDPEGVLSEIRALVMENDRADKLTPC